MWWPGLVPPHPSSPIQHILLPGRPLRGLFKASPSCRLLLERPLAARPSSADSPVEASSLLLLLQPDVFQLQRARDEADLAAFFHQTADPPVVVELLQIRIDRTLRSIFALSESR